MNFSQRFSLRYPIVQAPTGSIAGPELAAAVCQAGAMGAMALTWTDPATAAEQVHAVRSITSTPFLVNFALAFAPVALEAALEAGAPVVTFSWGDPAPCLPLVRSYRTPFGIQVTSSEGALQALRHEPDFLICQGIEAGGHVQATRSLHACLREVVAAAGETPVVAAGGMGNGEDIAVALRLGASAVCLGTRFVVTEESRAHPDYKRRIVAAQADESALTICFDKGWPHAPHRVLRNTTLRAWEAAGCPAPGSRPGEEDVVGHTARGEEILRYEDTAPRTGFTGDIEAMCAYAGTSCGRIHDIPSAGELVHRLWQECESARH